MPKSPVTINVVDVAGDLALTQDAFDLHAKRHPNVVAKFNFTKAGLLIALRFANPTQRVSRVKVHPRAA